MSPAAGQPSKDLPRVPLASQHRFTVGSHDRASIGMDLGDPGLSEIFLRQDIDRELRPGLGNVDIRQLEDSGSIRVPDLRRPFDERHILIG
jgi:hypothetical protein